MSKNLTRKGLAFGALVALGTSVIAGAPAHAAAPTTLAIATSYGTTYNAILGQGFDLSVTSNGGAVAGDKVKLYIEGATASEISSTVPGLTTSTDLSTTTGSTGDVADVVAVSDTDKTAVVVASSAAKGGDGVTLAAGTYNQFLLSLNNTVTATRTIKVTPFVDSSIANGKPDAASALVAAETKGNTVEITFVKSSEVTATTTLSAPQIGASSLSATVALDKGINLEQLRTGNSNVNVFFTENGARAKASTDADATVNALWDKTSGALKASLSSITNIIAENKVYGAQSYFGTVAAGSKTGVISTKTVTKGADNILNIGSGTYAGTYGTINTYDLRSSIVDIEDDKFVAPAKTTNLNDGSGAGAGVSSFGVRKGTTTVAFSTEPVYKDDTNGAPIVAAGVPVKVIVTSVALASGSKFTLSGKTTDSTTAPADSFTVDTVTGADGKVTFDLGATGAAGDRVDVIVKVLNGSSYVAADTISLGWVAAEAQADAILVDAVGKTSATSNVSSLAVKAGGTYTLNFALYDTFGALYTGTAARYLQATGGSVTKFVDGKASITRNDAHVADDTNELFYSVTDSDAVATPTSGKKVVVYAQTNVTPGFVTATKGAESLTVSTKTFAAGDDRAAVRATKWSSSSLGTEITISGTLLNTDGVALKGSPVTISASGLLFSTGYENVAASTTNKVWGVGSLTVITDNTGAYAVRVYSNKSGKQEIKVVSGAATASVTPEWPAVVATKGSAISITAPASAAPGTTAAIIVGLTDSKGNAVKTDGSALTFSFSVRVSGAGSPSTINQFTDSDGLTKFNQVIGSGETGSFKITVTYDADGAGYGYAAITKEATVTIGSGVTVADPSAKIGSASHRVFVKIFDAKGARVTVKIDGKWFTFYNSNFSSPTVWSKRFALVKTAVKVYVDGDLVAAKTLKVVK